jgi:hypothetical protein
MVENLIVAGIEHTLNSDWQARRSAIHLIIKITRIPDTEFLIQSYKGELEERMGECRGDKFKPVREAATECLSILKSIPEPYVA